MPVGNSVENPFHGISELLYPILAKIDYQEDLLIETEDLVVVKQGGNGELFIQDPTEPKQRVTGITYSSKNQLQRLSVQDFNLGLYLTQVGLTMALGLGEYPRYEYIWDNRGNLANCRLLPREGISVEYSALRINPNQRWRRHLEVSTGGRTINPRGYGDNYPERLAHSEKVRERWLGSRGVPWQINFNEEAEKAIRKSGIRRYAPILDELVK